MSLDDYSKSFYDFHKELNYVLLFADCGDYSGYLAYGIWCREQGFFEAAYEYLKVAVHSRTLLSRCEMARVCFVLKKYDEAIRYTEMYADQGLYSYNFYQALSYYKLGQNDKFMECLRHVADDDQRYCGACDAKYLLDTLGESRFTTEPLLFGGVEQDFKDYPKAHIRYLVVSGIIAWIGLFLAKKSILLFLLSLIPIGFYALMHFTKDPEPLTIEKAIKDAHKLNPKAVCVPLSWELFKMQITNSEDLPFNYPITEKQIEVPKEKDYNDNTMYEVLYDGTGLSSAKAIDEMHFNDAKKAWERRLPKIIADIRVNRMRNLVERYDNGEQTDVIRDALKYLFETELVNDDFQPYPRTLPYATDISAIMKMRRKTYFEDDDDSLI